MAVPPQVHMGTAPWATPTPLARRQIHTLPADAHRRQTLGLQAARHQHPAHGRQVARRPLLVLGLPGAKPLLLAHGPRAERRLRLDGREAEHPRLEAADLMAVGHQDGQVVGWVEARRQIRMVVPEAEHRRLKRPVTVRW